MPLSPAAELVRDRLAERRQDLEELCPAGIDLAAQVTASVHAALHGDATSHRGDRGPRFWRGVLSGEHEFCLCDFARLCVEAPGTVETALELMASAIGRTLGDGLARASGTVISEAADLMESASSLVAQTVRAAEDGVMNGAELERIVVALRQHRQQLGELAAVIERQRRRPA